MIVAKASCSAYNECPGIAEAMYLYVCRLGVRGSHSEMWPPEPDVDAAMARRRPPPILREATLPLEWHYEPQGLGNRGSTIAEASGHEHW